MKCFNELLKRGRFTDYVARVYTKNEPSKLVHINANIVYDSLGRPVGAQGIIHDITKESRIRSLIETQRAELAAIVNHSPLGITLTEQGELKKYNKAFQNMIGYTTTEMLNLNPEDLVQKKDLKDYNQFKNEFDVGMKSYSEYISHMIKKDGSVILTKIIVTAILDENKYPRYRLSMFEDITEKSKQDKLFIEQQEQLKVIVENSPLGILLIKDKIIYTANKTFQTLLGYTQEELVSMTMREFIYKQDIEKTKTFVRKIERGAQNPVILIHRLVKKNKSLVTVKTSVSAVTNQVGSLDYMVAVFEDISKQENTAKQKEKLLKKLKISNQQLKEYAHVVSHDLKSPLRNINALVSWVKEDYQVVDTDTGNKHLDLIDSTVEKMETLINGILSYSSVISRKIRAKEVSLEETFRNIENIIFIPTHFSLKVPTHLPSVIGDEIRIQQLFQNLISNSIKYNDKKEGRIEIGCKEENEFCIISVKDNGIGINPKYHEKIFKMFQTLDASDSENSSGIGLSVVQKIVEQYEGEIYLDSEEGVGTTFFVKLKKYYS